MNSPPARLIVHDLVVEIETGSGIIRAVDGVSFEVGAARGLALVGASGSGKSVTALAAMGLLACPPANILRGEVLFEGGDILRTSERELRLLRGRRIAIVFQEPMSALNPIYAVGTQIAEAVRVHGSISSKDARARAVNMLGRLQMREPDLVASLYPHQLSGGMRQRVMIAMALVHQPSLVILDEATTALDGRIRAEVTALLASIKRESGTSLLLITHDLGLLGGLCEDTAVMSEGRIVEWGPTERVLTSPTHASTRALVEAFSRLSIREAQGAS